MEENTCPLLSCHPRCDTRRPSPGSTANISLTTYASCGSWRVFTTPTGIAAGRNLLFTAVLCFIPANRAFGFVPWF